MVIGPAGENLVKYACIFTMSAVISPYLISRSSIELQLSPGFLLILLKVFGYTKNILKIMD